MNKKLLASIIMAILIVAGGFYLWENSRTNDTDESAETQARNVVEVFGKSLKAVSVLAPKEIAAQTIQDNYKDFLTPDLLNQWMSDPSKALGRITSSPWPDRIEIKSVQQISPTEYKVEGDIIELTSVELSNGGIAAKEKIDLTVVKADDGWKISSVNVTPYDETANWKTIAAGNFTLKHPENYKLEQGLGLGGDNLDTTLLKISLPNDMFKNEPINYVEAYLTLSKSNKTKIVSGCEAYKDIANKMNTEVGTYPMNNFNFKTQAVIGAAAGNIYNSHLYRVLLDKTCYQVALTVHTGNIGNYGSNVKEFDQTRAFSLLEKILRTTNLIIE